MKLSNINISSVLGIKRIALKLDTPVAILAGDNAAGKSSVAECVRMALMDEVVRVDHKKDLPQIVRDGNKAGSVEIVVDGKAAKYALPDGEAKGLRPSDPAALQWCLEPGLFARESAEVKRSALFHVMKLACDGPAVVERLEKRGLEEAKIDAIAPLLRQGFELAAKEAAKRSTEAKGAWRGVTGEPWGSKKSEDWKAEQPTFTDDQVRELTQSDKRIENAQRELADALKRQGIAEHEEQQRAAREKSRADLQAKASKLQEHENGVAIAEKDLAQFEIELAEAKEAAEEPARLECPHCKYVLMLKEGALAIWEAPKKISATAAKAMRELLADINETKRRRDQHRDAAAESHRAAGDLALMKDAGKSKASELASIRSTIDELNKSIAAEREKRYQLQGDQASSAAADKRTKDAAAHHADVLAWGAIADALAPGGIPGEILAEALGPINKRLAQSALDLEWRTVTIDEAMTIRYGGRPHRLCSTSEKFRADVMIAEAISHLAEVKLLMLDGFDVLSDTARRQVIEWLDTLAFHKEIDTAIVLGTLPKAEFAELKKATSEDVLFAWIEAGELVEPKKEKEAA